MVSAMRVMFMLAMILGVSVSVQARNFPNNHPADAAMKLIQITGVSSHARDWFISTIYGDYKYLSSTNIVGKSDPPPPPPPKRSPGTKYGRPPSDYPLPPKPASPVTPMATNSRKPRSPPPASKLPPPHHQVSGGGVLAAINELLSTELFASA